MQAFRRNVVVGATVLIALFLLGYMIVRFSDAPFAWFAQEQIPIELVTSTAEGLSEGSAVFYKGVSVGRVTALRRSPDQTHVLISVKVDAEPPLPANLEGRIRSQLFGGASSISLVLVPAEPQSAGADVQPVGTLNAGAELTAVYVGIDILPKEFSDLAVDFRQTSQELRRLTTQIRESDLVPKLVATVEALQTDINKAGKLIESVDSLVSDQQLRADLRQSLANFRTASESTTRIGVRLEKLTESGQTLLATSQEQVERLGSQLSDRMVQVAKVLDSINAAAAKLNEGEGAAAQFLNNPALYENLLDVSQDLSGTVADLNRLIQQWEQEGIYFKLAR